MLLQHLKYDINAASFDTEAAQWKAILYAGGWVSSATVCAVTKAPPESHKRKSFDAIAPLLSMQEAVG